MRFSLLLRALALACLTFWSLAAFAQGSDPSWLIGIWEGEQFRGAASGGVSRSRVEFKSVGEQVAWELVLVSARGNESKASGLATVFGDNAAMEGKYYSGRYTEGDQPLRHS